MKSTIVCVLTCLVFSGTGLAADMATHLRSSDNLSRSPVVQWENYLRQQQQDTAEANIPTIDRSFFKSMLIPGWGQFGQKKYLRTAVFLGVEAAVLTGYFIYNNKYNDQLEVSHEFAREHWSLEQWLINYDYELHTHSIHVRCTDGNEPVEVEVPQLNDQNEVFIPDQILMCTNREMVWNGEAYENVYKYDQFAGGWESYSQSNPDNTRDEDQYYINPDRKKNKQQREEANDYAETATLFIYGLIGNHVISAFEALLIDGPREKNNSSPKFGMHYAPRQVGKNLYSSVNFQLEW